MVVGTCICPICYDLQGIAQEAWKGNFHRTRIHAPASKPYLELHCPTCGSKLRGRALWLWLNNPIADSQWEDSWLSLEDRKKRSVEDVGWTKKRAGQDRETFIRLRYAGLRPKDDLWCPICQRTPKSQQQGPSLWIAHEASHDHVGKCRRCMTLFYGTSDLISWRKRQSLERKEVSIDAAEHREHPDGHRSPQERCENARGCDGCAEIAPLGDNGTD